MDTLYFDLIIFIANYHWFTRLQITLGWTRRNDGRSCWYTFRWNSLWILHQFTYGKLFFSHFEVSASVPDAWRLKSTAGFLLFYLQLGFDVYSKEVYSNEVYSINQNAFSSRFAHKMLAKKPIGSVASDHIPIFRSKMISEMLILKQHLYQIRS